MNRDHLLLIGAVLLGLALAVAVLWLGCVQ